MKVVLLGTGSNGGSPQIDEPSAAFRKQKRLRSSVLVKIGEKNILVDCGPDIRQQLIKQKLSLQDLNLVIVSHLHWDHTLGLMEFSAHQQLQIPLLAAKKIQRDFLDHQLFGFLFQAKFVKLVKSLKGVKINFIEIPHSKQFPTFAIQVTEEGKSIVICSDIESIPNKLKIAIKKASLVIFGGTFFEKRISGHICIKDSVPILSQLTSRVIFVHINHSEDSKKIENFIKPLGFQVGFDGMEVNI